jgi:hypothetical protein
MGGRAVLGSLALPFAVLTALTLTSSNPAPWAPPLAVGYEELLSHREVTLYYPGSRLLAFSGHGEYPERCQATLSLMCVPADVAASAYTILTADAMASADIFLWYQEQLSRRGWRPGYSNAEEARVYERGLGERFQLFVSIPEATREPLSGTASLIQYQTTYSLTTCPSIDTGCRTNVKLPPANLPNAYLYFPRSVWMASEGGPSRQSPIRAYLVAPGGSTETVAGWYDRTLTSHGWFKVSSTPTSLEYRHEGGESLLVTFAPGQAVFGYAVSGLTYTVLYSIRS